MLKIGICDDEKRFLETFQKNLKMVLMKQHWEAEISLFLNGKQLLEENMQQKFDIIFLDIDMPDDDGFSIAKKISDKNTLLIFCTIHNELVYDSFSYQPFWFLCKDNYENNLEEVMLSAKKRKSLENTNYKFDINGEVHNLNVKEIIYFDVAKHRIYVHLSDGKQINFRGNLSEIEEIFQDYGFVRVNSGCLINMLWIKHIYQTNIELRNGQSFSLSRGRKNDIKEKFHIYTRLKR